MCIVIFTANILFVIFLCWLYIYNLSSLTKIANVKQVVNQEDISSSGIPNTRVASVSTCQLPCCVRLIRTIQKKTQSQSLKKINTEASSTQHRPHPLQTNLHPRRHRDFPKVSPTPTLLAIPSTVAVQIYQAPSRPSTVTCWRTYPWATVSDESATSSFPQHMFLL